MRSWIQPIVILPVAIMLSTVALPMVYSISMGFGGVSWVSTAVELSLATGVVWLWTRDYWPRSRWRAWLVACSEGWILLAVALSVAVAFGVLAFHFNGTWWTLLPPMAVAIPLAWWCMAEEVVLRVLLPLHLPTRSIHATRILQWLIATAVVWLLSTPTSWYALVVIATGELLGVVTAHCTADFTTMWARRWAWRWLMAGVLGATQLGIVLAVPSLFTMIITEALVPAMVTAGVLVVWSSATVLLHLTDQHYRDNHHDAEHEPNHAR